MKSFLIFLMIPCILPMVWSSFDCKTDSDCQHGYCCSKIPRILAVSKRDVVDPSVNLPPDWIVSSSCKPYIKTNSSCAYVITVNGDCGCEPTTHCHYFPELNALPTLKSLIHADRSGMFGNPNAYLCTHD